MLQRMTIASHLGLTQFNHLRVSMISTSPPNKEKDGLMQTLEQTLGDAVFMIREELQYIRTGKHPGVPMRDCRGQWLVLQRELESHLMNQREQHTATGSS